MSTSAVQFFPPDSVPALNELVEVQYRGLDVHSRESPIPSRIAAQQSGSDDGVRGSVREVKTPSPRTSADCENAALALLSDAAGTAWSGQYDTWSTFLPGNAEDIFPGDALNVSVASRAAAFHAIVREVEIEIKDMAGEHSTYKIRFADDVASPLAFEFQSGSVVLPQSLVALTTTQVGTMFMADLTAAEITQATSTTVNVDAGMAPVGGGSVLTQMDRFRMGTR